MLAVAPSLERIRRYMTGWTYGWGVQNNADIRKDSKVDQLRGGHVRIKSCEGIKWSNGLPNVNIRANAVWPESGASKFICTEPSGVCFGDSGGVIHTCNPHACLKFQCCQILLQHLLGTWMRICACSAI